MIKSQLSLVHIACCSLLLSSQFMASIDLEKHSSKHNADTNDRDDTERMVESNTGQDHRDNLSARHDDGEVDWAQLVDGVVDEELSTSRADAEDDTVRQEPVVLRHELQRGEEHSLLEQRHAGEETREQIDPGHHLVW